MESELTAEFITLFTQSELTFSLAGVPADSVTYG